MRHQVDGRKFGRNTSHRVALFRNLANAVVEREQIVTTLQKAKEARRVVDRLITLGKDGTEASRRLAFSRSRNTEVVGRLFGELAERYRKRAGGYTRIVRISERRWGDAAEMAVLELVDHPVLNRKRQPKAEATDTAQGADAEKSAAAQPTDPFNRFRRLFAGSKKGGPGKMAAKGRGKSGGAARKTPAAGGSNKSGGSSD